MRRRRSYRLAFMVGTVAAALGEALIERPRPVIVRGDAESREHPAGVSVKCFVKSRSRISFLLGGVLVSSLLAALSLTPKSLPSAVASRLTAAGSEPLDPVKHGLSPSVVRSVPRITEVPRLVPGRPVEAQPVPATDGFQSVPLTQLRQPLPDNEVWLVRTVLLNPEKGTLAEPGGWAAPAQRFRDGRTWK